MVRRGDELRVEGGDDELAGGRGVVGLFADHGRYGGAVLRVQCCVDLVEKIERRRVAALDGEDEGERYERLRVGRERGR